MDKRHEEVVKGLMCPVCYAKGKRSHPQKSVREDGITVYKYCTVCDWEKTEE